jgi:hypothetical protein
MFLAAVMRLQPQTAEYCCCVRPCCKLSDTNVCIYLRFVQRRYQQFTKYRFEIYVDGQYLIAIDVEGSGCGLI